MYSWLNPSNRNEYTRVAKERLIIELSEFLSELFGAIIYKHWINKIEEMIAEIIKNKNIQKRLAFKNVSTKSFPA